MNEFYLVKSNNKNLSQHVRRYSLHVIKVPRGEIRIFNGILT